MIYKQYTINVQKKKKCFEGEKKINIRAPHINLNNPLLLCFFFSVWWWWFQKYRNNWKLTSELIFHIEKKILNNKNNPTPPSLKTGTWWLMMCLSRTDIGIAWIATDTAVTVGLKMMHSTYMPSCFQKTLNLWNVKFFDF